MQSRILGRKTEVVLGAGHHLPANDTIALALIGHVMARLVALQVLILLTLSGSSPASTLSLSSLCELPDVPRCRSPCEFRGKSHSPHILTKQLESDCGQCEMDREGSASSRCSMTELRCFRESSMSAKRCFIESSTGMSVYGKQGSLTFYASGDPSRCCFVSAFRVEDLGDTGSKVHRFKKLCLPCESNRLSQRRPKCARRTDRPTQKDSELLLLWNLMDRSSWCGLNYALRGGGPKLNGGEVQWVRDSSSEEESLEYVLPPKPVVERTAEKRSRFEPAPRHLKQNISQGIS